MIGMISSVANLCEYSSILCAFYMTVKIDRNVQLQHLIAFKLSRATQYKSLQANLLRNSSTGMYTDHPLY